MTSQTQFASTNMGNPGAPNSSATATATLAAPSGRMAADWRWTCPHAPCTYTIPFGFAEIEAVPFHIIRHLHREHGMTPAEIIADDPTLA